MKDFLDSGERNDTPSNEYLARENERISELESQVRELTAQRDQPDCQTQLKLAADYAFIERLGFTKEIDGNVITWRNKRADDAESQVAELRATVEKLERLRAEFIWLAHCPSRPTFCNCRAHVALEAELSDMRKGSL